MIATGKRASYLGPRLRRLRRDLGLTQAQMAADLGISASYIALMERNQRPVTAELLLRLAQGYKLDIVSLAEDRGEELAGHLAGILRDPIFSDLDIPPLEVTDAAMNYPGVAEAMLRLYRAAQQDQIALANRAAEGWTAESGKKDARSTSDPVTEVQHFLAANRNSFPLLDDAAERLARDVAKEGGLVGYFSGRCGLRVRFLPPATMVDVVRRYDRHHEQILISDALSHASRQFQLAVQLAHMVCDRELVSLLDGGSFSGENSRRLARRALAAYTAAALRMPYTAFAKAVDELSYDIDALSRRFETSFEQTAHRLTTLQKLGQERVPFFFIRVDAAGNISKRLDGAGFPFARHAGGCPRWSLHTVFRTPGEIVTEWIELPDGERFFSVARTVRSGGSSYAEPHIDRAIALVCAASDAGKLVYAHCNPDPGEGMGTPIGVTCRLCHRAACPARALPPMGRALQSDKVFRENAPYSLADEYEGFSLRPRP